MQIETVSEVFPLTNIVKGFCKNTKRRLVKMESKIASGLVLQVDEQFL